MFEDFARLLRRLIPHDTYYAHDDWDRRTENICEEDMEVGNGHSHCMSMVLGSASESIPVAGSELQLGIIAGKVGGYCETRLIPDCGHSPHLQQPNQVLAEIARFVAPLALVG